MLVHILLAFCTHTVERGYCIFRAWSKVLSQTIEQRKLRPNRRHGHGSESLAAKRSKKKISREPLHKRKREAVGSVTASFLVDWQSTCQIGINRRSRKLIQTTLCSAAYTRATIVLCAAYSQRNASYNNFMPLAQSSTPQVGVNLSC